MILETHEVLEVAQIATIITHNIDFDKLYNLNNEGYIGTTHLISEWALEFYLKEKDTDWQDRLETEGCWDDCIINYAKNKIENYGR